MSSFILQGFEPDTKVQLTEGLTEETLLEFKSFMQWAETLKLSLSTQAESTHAFTKSPYKLRSIKIQAVDIFAGPRIGFLKFNATVTNDDGEWLPGAVFMRGGSVAMLVTVYTHHLRLPANFGSRLFYSQTTFQKAVTRSSMLY